MTNVVCSPAHCYQVDEVIEKENQVNQDKVRCSEEIERNINQANK